MLKALYSSLGEEGEKRSCWSGNDDSLASYHEWENFMWSDLREMVGNEDKSKWNQYISSFPFEWLLKFWNKKKIRVKTTSRRT